MATIDAGLCGAADAAANGACCATPTSPTSRVICQASAAASIPWGAPVTVAAGVGPAPTGQGGTIVEGAYQLVSAVVYGTPPPNVATPHAGDSLRIVLDARCDVFDELYQTSLGAGATSSGNDCGRLVSPGPSLVDVSGLAPDGGDPWRDHYAYSATDQTLTVISLEPYSELGTVLVSGSYTVVDEFALVSAGTDASIGGTGQSGDGGAPPVSAARDPRCPSGAPSMGDPCNPMPAPLQCEYGGGAWGRCTTVALCALEPDGTFGFQITQGPGCPAANVAACPSAFGTDPMDAGAPALDAGACTAGAPLSCSYDEGVCGCVNSPGGPMWGCRARSSVTPTPAAGPVCPAKRPLAGDGCSSEGENCDYDSPCDSAISLGLNLYCENGYWEGLYSATTCPAFSN
jgi:hypothetical protein